MKKHVGWLLASLLLSGCSSFSFFSGFGTGLELNDNGLGTLSSQTMLDEAQLTQALNDRYRLRKGMRIRNGEVITFYEALDDKTLALVFYADEQNRLTRIDVLDKRIKTANGTQVGVTFNQLYEKAFGVCAPGQEEEHGKVICQSPESQHIRYVFSGRWLGPAEIMPSNDKLAGWTLSKMIWLGD